MRHLRSARTRTRFALVLSLVIFVTTATHSFASSPTVGFTPGTSVGAKVLLVTNSLTENGGAPVQSYSAIRTALRRYGVPFDEFAAVQEHAGGNTLGLNPGSGVFALQNSSGNGKYHAVIVAPGDPAALSASEAAALAEYEAAYGVRHLAYNTAPSHRGSHVTGNTKISTATTATIPAGGAALFPYLAANVQIPVSGVSYYLATPATPITPVVEITDGSDTYPLAYVHENSSDGFVRDELVVLADQKTNLWHTDALNYGYVRWVTKGAFLGQRMTFLTPEVDDVLIASDTYPSGTYRTTAADVNAFTAWQQTMQARPIANAFRTTMAFNGAGYSGADTASQAWVANKAAYTWLNHTWAHPNLNSATAAFTQSQITQNNSLASTLALPNYSTTSLITGEYSGLSNANALTGMVNAGVTSVICDATTPSCQPLPNLGVANAVNSAIFMVPRNATEIGYNASTPQQETDSYNARHGASLTYAQIVANEADSYARRMLWGDARSLMYHQNNLRAYDGTHSLLGDVMDAAVDRYAQFYSAPIRSAQPTPLAASFADNTAVANALAAGTLKVTIDHDSMDFVNTGSSTLRVRTTGVHGPAIELYAGDATGVTTVPVGTTSVPLYGLAAPPAPQTATYGVTADTYVDSQYYGSNYGTTNTMWVDGAPTSMLSYVRFVVPNTVSGVQNVKLRLYSTNGSVDGGQVYAVSSAWSETTTTWNTRPTLGAAIGGAVGTVGTNAWKEFDLTGYVTGPGTYSVAISTGNADGAQYVPREGPVGQRPEVVVTAASVTSSQTASFNPVADTYANEQYYGSNYGSFPNLWIDAAPTNVISYLKFVVPNTVSGVTNATLRLYNINGTVDGGQVFAISNSWAENTLTWNNRPTPGAAVSAPLGAAAIDSFKYVDLTSYITGPGTYSIAIITTSGDSSEYASREATAAATRPLLTITGATASTLSTATYGLDADSYVNETYYGSNYGNFTNLWTDGQPVNIFTYVKFTVPASVSGVGSAKLRLYCTNGSTEGGAMFHVGNGWTETGITWANKTTGPQFGSNIGQIVPDTWHEFDVSSIVSGPGTYSVALVNYDGDSFECASRQAASNQPQVVITAATV